MKHLLLISTSFPDDAFAPGQEAAGGFVADFAKALASHVSLSIVAPSLKTAVQQHSNVTIHRFGVPSLPLSLLKPQNPAHWSSIVQTLRSGQQAVTEAVAKQKPDHIISLWALHSGAWARRVAKQHNIPYRCWPLGSDIWPLGQVPVVRSLLRTVLRDATRCFADGFVLADDTSAISSLPCEFLPSSRKLDISQPKPLAQSPPYKLAFLGRWHPNKGIDLLLESLKLLDERCWQQIEAVKIFGGGPMEDEVKTAVSQLQAASRPIQLGGYLNQAEATNLFLWADYQLIPSRIESIPVIFSDAMQANCPIVTMPVGDLPRLVQEYAP